MSEQQKGTVYIISDGTGETASTMTRAALVQYSDHEINIVRCKNVRTEMQIDSVIDQAFANQGIIVYTVVSPSMRSKIRDSASSKGLRAIDLLGPLLDELSAYFGDESKAAQVGLLRTVDERYYKRIEAIEYTVKHDDGKCLTDLDQADVILVGISRTSKTPLSIFLSHKGWKVANIPLVLGTILPEELFKVDQRKIVGLVIADDKLSRIRQKRLEKFGHDPQSEYASLSQIHKELEYALEIFRKHKRWPVFDVTERALEETASEITRVVSSRMGLPDSVLF
jgi:regulator of PEP synthase PpsR (kinase-PPPase family)